MQDLMNLGYRLFFMGGRAIFFIAGARVRNHCRHLREQQEAERLLLVQT